LYIFYSDISFHEILNENIALLISYYSRVVNDKRKSSLNFSIIIIFIFFDSKITRFKGVAQLETKENILIETNDSNPKEVTSALFVDNCTIKDEGDFKVVAQNVLGEVSHVANLKVISKYMLCWIM